MRIQLAYQSVVPITSKPVYNLSSLPVTWFDIADEDVIGLDEFVLTDERENGNQVMRKISGDLLFYNATKDLILSNFYENNAQYMWARVYDCVCDTWIFKGQITRDKIEWCSGDCFLRTRISEYNEVTDAYLSLNNPMDYDNYLAIGENIINFPSRFSSGISAYFKYFEGVRIGGILKATIENQPEFVFISSILNTKNSLNGWTGDNYNYSPSSYTYQSDLNPYYYAYLLNCDVSPLLKERYIGNHIRDEHKYTKNTKQFFEMLKPVFNADYLIKKTGSVVQFIFERKDYFYQSALIWKDCTDYNVCFEIDNRNMYAYFKMDWTQLGFSVEIPNTEYYNKQYNDIREWNNPVNPLQKDEYSAYITYSWMPFFGYYTGSTVLEDCLNMKGRQTISPPSILIAGYNRYNSTDVEFIFDGLGGYDPTKYSSPVHHSNSPMWANGNCDEIFGTYKPNALAHYEDCNLYDNFHFVENPRNIANSRGNFGKYQRKWLRYSLTIDFTCDEFLSFQPDSAIYINVFGSSTKAIIDTIEWTFKGDETYRGIAKITGRI